MQRCCFQSVANKISGGAPLLAIFEKWDSLQPTSALLKPAQTE